VSFRAGTGNRVRETVRGTKAEAERRLTALLAEHDRSGLIPDRETTVAMFAKRWLAHVANRIKPSTLKRYRELIVGHVLPVLGPVKIGELRAAGVQVVIDRTLERRSARTAVNVYRVLSEMLGEATRWGVIPVNPAGAIRPPRVPRPPLHIPNPDACSAILDRVRETDLEGPVTMALGTGMRLGEILGLRWKDVDLPRAVLRVTATLAYSAEQPDFPSPKTSRARRSIDLPDFVVAQLRRQRKAQLERRVLYGELWTDHDVVFDGDSGAPTPPWRVSVGFSRLIREMGLPRIRFHDLRHAHASALLVANCHPKVVSERLGHSSVAFTMDVYAHIVPSMGREAASAIEDVLGA